MIIPKPIGFGFKVQRLPLLDTAHKISDHQQSWGYEDGPWKGPGPALLMAT